MTAQNVTKPWKPRPTQRRVLEAAQAAGVNRTITAVCEEAKISRRAFYNWLDKDPDFADAWDNVWRRSITRHYPSIIAAQIQKARAGDTAAARLVTEIGGNIKQVVKNEGKVEVLVRYEDDNPS